MVVEGFGDEENVYEAEFIGDVAVLGGGGFGGEFGLKMDGFADLERGREGRGDSGIHASFCIVKGNSTI